MGAEADSCTNAGTRLDQYEVRELISAGGMGEVYKARDKHLDRTVAIHNGFVAVPSVMSRLQDFRRQGKSTQ